MKKTLLFTVVLLALASVSFAHNATVSGKVLSSYNSQPMSEAGVSLKGTAFKTTTDGIGEFSFKEIPARDYVVVIEKKGYYNLEKTIDLQGDQVLTLTLSVYPELISLPEVSTITTVKSTQAASSEVLSGVDLAIRPRNNAQEMLMLVPGLFLAQHAGGGKAEQIFVRGFDCDHGTDIATFVDGMPVNMPSHGHGQGYADLHFLIPETVNKMEINKGPYNVQYGDFATAAAVQFKTYDSLPRSQATVEIGSTPTNRAFSSSRILLMGNIPTGTSKISSYVAGEYNYTLGYFEHDQKFGRYNLFAKVKGYISNSTSISFEAAGYGASWDASGQVPERAVASGQIDRFGSEDPTEGGTTQRQNFVLALRNFHDNRQLDITAYYSRYRFKLNSDFTFYAVDSVNGDEIEQDDERNVIGVNAVYGIYEQIGGIKGKTTFGLGFRSDDIQNALWHVPQRSRLNAEQQAHVFENSMNVWVKQDFEFTKWLHADIGLRYDYFTFDVDDLLPTDASHQNYSGYTFQSLPGYKVNLVFSPVRNFQIYLNNGLGYHSNDARVVVQDRNNHFLPMVLGEELGAQLNVANRAVFNVAFWMMDSKDELVYNGDVGTTEDNGPSRRMGIDFSTRVQILKWLYFDADINPARPFYTDNFLGRRLSADYHIPLAPTFTSAGGFTVRHKSGFTGRVGYRAIANHAANPDNTLVAKGYFLMDLALGYEHKHYAINLTVVNMLNAKWNEAQFETVSRLKGEEAPVDDLNFTPGTPVALKLGFSAFF